MGTSRRLLFVCMGNICRSPAAEGVMQKLVADAGLEERIECDSAGTIGYHSGDRADPRMQEASERRGYSLLSRSRRVKAADLDAFDLVLAMDRANFDDLQRLARNDEQKARIKLFCDHCEEHVEREVPDPYYGGEQGFELVLDLLEDGCRCLLRDLRAQLESE